MARLVMMLLAAAGLLVLFLSSHATPSIKPHIVVMVPVRLKGVNMRSGWSFARFGFPSFLKTIEPARYQYTILLGVDQNDTVGVQKCRAFDRQRNPTIETVVGHMVPFTRAVNALAKRAHELKADYTLRINDDARFMTEKWTSMAIDQLNRFDPPGVGVVGPVHQTGNMEILVFDFVSRRHYDIHGMHYPPELSNWWADDWITKVYLPNRSKKIRSWRINHMTTHGTRYNVDHKEFLHLKHLIDTGKMAINDAIGYNPNAVSFSLYGANPRYTDGAIANARLVKSLFPGWHMRVYHDSTVPRTILDALKMFKHVKLIPMNRSVYPNPMVWRFLVASDPSVQRYTVRDIDSRLSRRDAMAVLEWTRSQRPFHVLRDHPSHSAHPMSGGMWGGTHDAIPDMVDRLQRNRIKNRYLQDMTFLAREVWPLAKSRGVLQHDSFSCKAFGALPFPEPRVGLEHVGSVYIDGTMRKVDTDILRKARPNGNPCERRADECATPTWHTIAQNKDLTKRTVHRLDALLTRFPNPTNDWIVDVGGNMGHFSQAMTHQWPGAPLYIVEAIPWFALKLKKKFPNATVVNAAVSDRNGPQTNIYGERGWRSPQHMHTGASMLVRGINYESVVTKVPTHSLDAMLGNRTVHFLKIDTEGMDGRVLRGATRLLKEHHIRHIYWENNKMQELAGDNLYANVQFLESMGYTSYAVGSTLHKLTGCPGHVHWFDPASPTGNVLSTRESASQHADSRAVSTSPPPPPPVTVDARHPYPVRKMTWMSCKTPHTPVPWRVVSSSDTNANYLGFLPSFAAHWSRLGARVSVALVLGHNESFDVGVASKLADVHVIRCPPTVDKGHAAKLARTFLASSFEHELVTVVDIDYYLFKHDQWKSHFGCVDWHRRGLLGLGYNRYAGTPDQGKFPMYLCTAMGSTFAHVFGSAGLAFHVWIARFKDVHVFDAKESPHGSYGTFSDESLLRALLSLRPVQVVWVNTPASWYRIDRSSTNAVTPSQLRKAYDVFPNRPMSCSTYQTRLVPVHRQLGIVNASRDADFLSTLTEARHWGSTHSSTAPSLESCVARTIVTSSTGMLLDIVYRTPSVVAAPKANPSILALCPKLNRHVFWECQPSPAPRMPCSDHAFIGVVRQARVSDARVHPDVPGTVFTAGTIFKWQAYVRPVQPMHPSTWTPAPRIVRMPCVASALQAYPGARGHFPHEVLPRILFLHRYIPLSCPILFTNSTFVWRYLSLLQWSRRLVAWNRTDVVEADRVYVANEAPYCTTRNPHNGGMSTFFQPDVMALVRDVFVEPSWPAQRHIVLIQRTGARRYAQHDDLLRILEKTADRVVVFNASGSLTDHIRLFSAAWLVIGPHGAGFSNLIFCRPRTMVIEIGWDGKVDMEMDNMYARVSASLGLDYHLVLGHGQYNDAIHLNAEAVANII